MITFILPGFSEKNKLWAEEAARYLKVEGTIRPIFWEHWTDPDYKFIAKEKANLIAKHSKGDKINIVAKSIGTLVASYIVQEIPDQIVKAILCGIPVNDLEKNHIEFIKETVRFLGERAIIFQNNEDPHGKIDQIKDFGKVVSKPRNDHNYPYYDDFNTYLTS